MSRHKSRVLFFCAIGAIVILLPTFLMSIRTKIKEQSATLDRMDPEVQAILKRLEAAREQEKKSLSELNDMIANLHACNQEVLGAAIRLNSAVKLSDEEFRKRMLELSDKIRQQSAEGAGMDGG